MLLRDAIICDITNKFLAEDELVSAVAPSALISIPSKIHSWMRNQPTLSLVDNVMLSVVMANVIIIGVSTDVNRAWRGWDVISAAFALMFLAELAIKLCFLGCKEYFFGRDARWHIFDFILALIALLDIIALAVKEMSSDEYVDTSSLSLMRLVRLSRLTRIARLARAPVFQELSIMIRGIVAGTRTLIWALILTLSVSYVGGVLLAETVGQSLSDEHFEIYRSEHFSTVLRSMFTVFRCCTGDCSAFDGKPLSLAALGTYGTAVIVVYTSLLMIVNLGLFNVIISIFIQSTQRASRFNDEERRRMRIKERKRVAEKSQAFLRRAWQIASRNGSIPTTRSGHDLTNPLITRAHFQEMVKDPQIDQLLDDLGLEEQNRMTLFDLLDVSNAGHLGFVDLVQSIIRIGKSNNAGIEEIGLRLRSLHNRLVDLEGCLIFRNIDASKLGVAQSKVAI
eukprot:TRINITY_DN8837_c0_g1_i1.p1 TRINITY_DN8837_c0_g1~~TRINITY_DN8837_c0_g1_i1.p1  ORF type:complete len:452 (-),score=49.45 TRINITY_DN8837_c0_g1_i1:153-1508(-)